MKLIERDSKSKVIIFTISTTNQKMLSYLPNLNDLICETNELIKSINLNKNIKLIDIDRILYEYDKNIHMPDGFHYSEEIHKIIYKKIEKIINDDK